MILGLYSVENFLIKAETAELVRMGERGPYRYAAESVSHRPEKIEWVGEVW
jgi:hypothetical protein